MGSQAIQGQLWGKRPKDWASIQEKTGNAGYEHALATIEFKSSDKVLDVGCGTGYFCDMAKKKGIDITGIDASEPLIEEAKSRNSSITFQVGEMEELPFGNASFDVVTGFNSFQYAGNVKAALTEAKRVLKKGGKIVAMIWGNKEECEAATYLKAVGSLLPPPPPGAAGPFALSDNQLLEKTLEEVGFKIINNDDIESVWDYPTSEIALKGLISAGPVARAIDNSGLEKVTETLTAAIKPYTKDNGHVVYNNKFRVVVAENI